MGPISDRLNRSGVNALSDGFPPCPACGANEWNAVYQGRIRDGAFGSFREEARIARCRVCGIDRLDESFCLIEDAYESDAYRKSLRQETSQDHQYALQDPLVRFALRAAENIDLRGKVVADIGCASGALLDHVRGLARHCIGIEPGLHHHHHLRERGYGAYSFARRAHDDWGGKVDVVFSTQVIEHVVDPMAFLSEIRPLLAPGGIVVISTPNRDDILLELMGDAYASFFYRSAHRWYFDFPALARCATAAGFTQATPRYVHRYSLSNAFKWLRDNKPGGTVRFPGISDLADDQWRSFLESSGRSDCLFALLTV